MCMYSANKELQTNKLLPNTIPRAFSVLHVNCIFCIYYIGIVCDWFSHWQY